VVSNGDNGMKRRPGRPRTPTREVEFEIDHVDPLGQGVSKQGGKVTFIAGTLPGERGVATVYKQAKGVQFARLLRLDEPAKNRIEPECPHFERCPGCQFLHTTYTSELDFKRAALARCLAPFGVGPGDIEVVPAPRRLGYRNRVQLHYRHKYIGMLDTVDNEVLEIPACRILRPELQAAFDRLYAGGWQAEHTGHGHCELYFRANDVSVSWDGDYAHGGFTQVYEEMNRTLQERVQEQLEKLQARRLLDLFSGDGNLSGAFAAKTGDRVMIDSFRTGDESENFYQADLYSDQTLPNFMRTTGGEKFDTLLADPPRRGFPMLASWVKTIKPAFLVYVSCNPASLARDLRGLENRFRITTVQLLDLFPATSHFESLVVLKIR
jgi:23S rRNA (uracil1939-C5)-methyltransferase